MRACIKANLGFLQRVPSAFFSVSLSAISSATQERQAAGYLAEKFVQELGWQPDRTEIIGGAVPYTRYGFLKRLVMKMIMKKHGSDTDTSRDYEYTDWDAVTRFAEDFLNTLEKRKSGML